MQKFNNTFVMYPTEHNVQSAEKIEALLHENEVLKNELNGKINDVESLKQDKFNLIGEIVSIGFN